MSKHWISPAVLSNFSPQQFLHPPVPEVVSTSTSSLHSALSFIAAMCSGHFSSVTSITVKQQTCKKNPADWGCQTWFGILCVSSKSEPAHTLSSGAQGGAALQTGLQAGPLPSDTILVCQHWAARILLHHMKSPEIFPWLRKKKGFRNQR